jgi:hypothetical protein
MGLMGTVGHFMLILAYYRAPAATLTPYLYAQIGFAMLGGWLVVRARARPPGRCGHRHDRGLRRRRRLADGARAPRAGAESLPETMAQYFELHPENPQPRLLKQAVALCQGRRVVAVPTDSSYAIACHLDDKAAADRLRQIRRRRRQAPPHAAVPRPERAGQLRARRQQAVPAAEVGHARALHLHPRSHREVPRRVSHPQRKTIGLRVPDHRCCRTCWRCTARRCWPPR